MKIINILVLLTLPWMLSCSSMPHSKGRSYELVGSPTFVIHGSTEKTPESELRCHFESPFDEPINVVNIFYAAKSPAFSVVRKIRCEKECEVAANEYRSIYGTLYFGNPASVKCGVEVVRKH